jgi:hypothetical protein
LRRAGALTPLIGIADDTQPQAAFFQIGGNISCKPFPFVIGTERMKTASIEHKVKRCAFNSVFKKVNDKKYTFDIFF